MLTTYPGWLSSTLRPGLAVWSNGRASFYVRVVGRRVRIVAYTTTGNETEYRTVADAVRAAN